MTDSTSETQSGSNVNPTLDAEVSRPKSAGTLLREAREACGLDLHVFASTLKIAPAKLEALEADELDRLPDMTFTRSLAKLVCKRLEIDDKQVLERLPQIDSSHAGNVMVQRTAGMSPVLRDAGGYGRRKSRIWWVLLALLLVVLGFLYFMPAQWRHSLLFSAGHSQTDTQPAELVNLPIPVEPMSEVPETRPAPSESSSENVAPQAVTGRQTVVHLDLPIGAAPPAASAGEVGIGSQLLVSEPVGAAGAPSVATAASPQNPTDAGNIRFITSADSWVTVRDAHGNKLAQKLMQAGDELTLPLSAAPLQVVVGNVGGTQVQVRGSILNMMSYTRNNVARFEVQ